MPPERGHTPERVPNQSGTATADQILEAAHSSRGARFHHFDSQRELASALLEHCVDADLGQLRAGLAAVDGTGDPVARALGFARPLTARSRLVGRGVPG